MTDITIENRAIRLAASVDGPANARAILFLHGLSLSRDTWEDTARRLTNQYRVWTLDFRGHGHCSRTSGSSIIQILAAKRCCPCSDVQVNARGLLLHAAVICEK